MKFFLEGVEDVDYVKLLEEKNNEEEVASVRNNTILKLEEDDIEILRKCLLFQNWDQSTFLQFIEDNHIYLRQFK
jgi:hypothetical protein